MKVTTLIENRPSRSDRRLGAEWGLSLHIAFDGHEILFDTGASGSFAKNAELLSVDLASVECAVLSHHHFDHAGGLRRFLELNSSATVHLGATPDGECFVKIFGPVKKYVGPDRTLMTDYPDRFEAVVEPKQILPDVFLFPHIVKTHPTPAGNRIIFLEKGGNLRPDDFDHEIVMAIKEDGKLVVLTGCSHSGILNMLDTVVRELPGIPIKAVIGGFHLVASPLFNSMAGSKRDVEELARLILSYPVDRTYTGHCTGRKALAVLEGVMGDRICDIRTGSSFEV